MKALQMQFFSTVNTQNINVNNKPKEIASGINGWSVKEFLYPAMKEGDFAWIDKYNKGDCKFLVGTRGQYIQWLSQQEEIPNPCHSSGYYPFGIYCVMWGGQYHHCHGYTNSSYCADSSDFMPVLWVFEGLPPVDPRNESTTIDWDVERQRLGSGVYSTYTKSLSIDMPRHFIHSEDRHEEENNFLQKVLEFV